MDVKATDDDNDGDGEKEREKKRERRKGNRMRWTKKADDRKKVKGRRTKTRRKNGSKLRSCTHTNTLYNNK